VLAATGGVDPSSPDLLKRSHRPIRLQDNVATGAPITAVRTTAGNVFLAPKTHAPSATISTPQAYMNTVYHRNFIIREVMKVLFS
jgi:hypothetical protein